METLYRSSGQIQYLAANSSQSAFSITAGRFTDFGLTSNAFVKAGNANHRLETMGDWRGVRLGLNGAGADGTTFDYRLWAAMVCFTRPVQEGHGGVGSGVDEVELALWAYGTATLSAMLISASGGRVPANNRIADTVTMTVASDATASKGVGQPFIDGYQLGQTVVYSPANDTPAFLVVPDFGSGVHGFILEFDMTGATSGNATLEKTK